MHPLNLWSHMPICPLRHIPHIGAVCLPHCSQDGEPLDFYASMFPVPCTGSGRVGVKNLVGGNVAGGPVVKTLCFQCRGHIPHIEWDGDLGLIPGLGRSPGEGKDNPLQYSLPGQFRGPRSLAGHNPWGRKESDMTEQLTHTHTLGEIEREKERCT